MSFFTELFHRLVEVYGCWTLFLSLLLEMLALPLPGEMLMTYTGLAVYQGKLGWLAAILAGGLTRWSRTSSGTAGNCSSCRSG